MSAPIDLRSDTVTKPTPAMREAMARAEVGDDVYGEDPTVNALQERIAALLGKEAALFVPSGSMANQIALKTHTQPGDDVLCGAGSHSWLYESGAGGAISGVQFTICGQGGLFSVADLEEARKPDNHHFAPTRLVCLENTHNRGGGRIWPAGQAEAVAAWARDRAIATHLDGARLWNAAVATGRPPGALARPFDSVSVCLSKGLGAPVGSLLAGARGFIHRAHRFRKMMGGGMRQAGILAAAGLFALEHHVERLAEDHANARRFAERVAAAPGIEPLAEVETNIVIFSLSQESRLDAEQLVARARERKILVSAIAPRRLRAVTHLDVDRDAAIRAAEGLAEILRAG
jgi:threonine aldolase